MRKLVLILPAIIALAGCGNSIVYQTRYIPRSSELSWDKDYEQLPWRQPALESNEHDPYHSNPQRPGAMYQTDYSLGRDPMNGHYDGDQCDLDLRDASLQQGDPRHD